MLHRLFFVFHSKHNNVDCSLFSSRAQIFNLYSGIAIDTRLTVSNKQRVPESVTRERWGQRGQQPLQLW